MRRLFPIYLTDFFFSLHYAAILYINSAFLEKFFSSWHMGMLFALGALLNIVLFIFTPRLLKKLGNRRLYIYLLVIELISVSTLALSSSRTLIAISFLAYSAVYLVVLYCLDIFLEDVSPEVETGNIRGGYLTIGNAAIACAPIILAFFVYDGYFRNVYLLSAVLLIPVLLQSLLSFRAFKDGKPRSHNIYLPIRELWADADLRRVTIVKFTLELFYAIMTIYTPIYLSQIIGFSWHTIGIIFAIMLLPFVMFEWPAGEAADKIIGEKELMNLGLAIMGIALLLMPHLHYQVALWAGVLFLSRIGASLIESMTEAYFFKKVDKRDAGLISIFRITFPVSILIGALIGAALSNSISFQALFLVMAALVFASMIPAARLRDTK